jgi:hypothetical protein
VLQVEQTPLVQLEQEPLCSVPSLLRESDLEGPRLKTLNFLIVCRLLQKGHFGETFSFIPFSISKVFPQSLHL